MKQSEFSCIRIKCIFLSFLYVSRAKSIYSECYEIEKDDVIVWSHFTYTQGLNHLKIKVADMIQKTGANKNKDFRTLQN